MQAFSSITRRPCRLGLAESILAHSGTIRFQPHCSHWRRSDVTSETERPVVLIVEDKSLIRMDAVDMIRTAGFDAANADEAIPILEGRLDITIVFQSRLDEALPPPPPLIFGMRYDVLMRYCGANPARILNDPPRLRHRRRHPCAAARRTFYTRSAIKTVQGAARRVRRPNPETRQKHQELSEVHLIAIRDAAVVLSP